MDGQKDKGVIRVDRMPQETINKLDILARVVGKPGEKPSRKRAIMEAIDRLCEHPDYKAAVQALSK